MVPHIPLTEHSNSVLVAKLVLRDLYFPSDSSVFSELLLRSSCVIELGAGIGFLGILLAPHVQRYIVTDIAEMIPLLKKNIKSCLFTPNIQHIDAEELDWVQLFSAAPSKKHAAFTMPLDEGAFDLLICSDCIYNTSLVPALIHTIDYCSTPGKTMALVVAELREEEVLREFLAAWLNVDGGRWEIRRLSEDCLDSRTVGWVGWKKVVE